MPKARVRNVVTIVSIAIAATSSLALGAAAAQGATAPSSWLQSGSNAGRSGYNAQESRLTAAVAHTLHPAWSLTTPVPCCDAPQTTSVVSTGGIAYVVGADADVHAVNARTGAAIWRRQAPECAESADGPALAGGLLLVPTQECTPDDFNSWLTAYDAATGRVVWSLKQAVFMTSPLVSGDLVFVQADPPQLGFRPRLVAVDLHTGAIRWHHVTSGAVAADAGNLYLSTANQLQALDPATGAVRWTRSAAGGHVLVSAGHVVTAGFTGGSQVITAYTPAGGRQWTADGFGPADFTLSATMTELVVADAGGEVVGSSLATGEFGWAGGFSTAITTQPAIAGGVVYVTVATPRSSAVYALRDGTGAVLWHFTEPGTAAGSDVTAAPTVADGTLFASLGTGVLRAFQPTAG
jgi:outer membrane protein assembly factor BamB